MVCCAKKHPRSLYRAPSTLRASVEVEQRRRIRNAIFRQGFNSDIVRPRPPVCLGGQVCGRAWKVSDPSRRRHRQPYTEAADHVPVTHPPPLAHAARASGVPNSRQGVAAYRNNGVRAPMMQRPATKRTPPVSSRITLRRTLSNDAAADAVPATKQANEITVNAKPPRRVEASPTVRRITKFRLRDGKPEPPLTNAARASGAGGRSIGKMVQPLPQLLL